MINEEERMLNEEEKQTLVDLLSRHDTPTEAVRKALNADRCELHLTFGERIVIVRDGQIKQ